MNISILKLYKGLSERQQQALYSRFPESPKISLLLQFLDTCKDEKFTALQAANYLYREELAGGLEISVAINRFYKLRKKLEEALAHTTGESTENTEPHPVISGYRQAIRLVDVNQANDALKKLKTLYDDALKDNIFEYLPGICEHIIYAMQIVQKGSSQDKWFRRWDIANTLQRDLNRAKYYSRLAFSLASRQSFEMAEPHIQVLRQMAARYKEYPRFNAIYHYAGLSAGSRSFGASPQSLGKHTKALEELLGKYPRVPWISITDAYYIDNEFSLRANKANFSMAKGLHRIALQDITAAVDLVKREPMLQRRLTMPLIINKIRLELLNELYGEALKSVRLLSEIGKRQGASLMAYAEVARIYMYAFPDRLEERSPELLSNLEMYIDEMQKLGREMEVADALGIKAILYYQEGKIKEGARCYARKNCREFFQSVGFDVNFTDLLFNTSEKNDEQLLQMIDKGIRRSSEASVLIFYKMLRRMVVHLR